MYINIITLYNIFIYLTKCMCDHMYERTRRKILFYLMQTAYKSMHRYIVAKSLHYIYVTIHIYYIMWINIIIIHFIKKINGVGDVGNVYLLELKVDVQKHYLLITSSKCSFFLHLYREIASQLKLGAAMRWHWYNHTFIG